jgi:hypothetical protein
VRDDILLTAQRIPPFGSLWLFLTKERKWAFFGNKTSEKYNIPKLKNLMNCGPYFVVVRQYIETDYFHLETQVSDSIQHTSL